MNAPPHRRVASPARLSRRAFLEWGAVCAAVAPLAARRPLPAAEVPAPGLLAAAKVALVQCRDYAPETVRAALAKSFDLLGGIGALVTGKTVTVKLNLTGTNFAQFQGRPVGETYMTHPATAHALAALLIAAGARRVRFVESTQSKAALEETLQLGGWDLQGLRALGAMEFENTRNLGLGRRYATLRVPGGGRMFDSFELNHAYDETDVLVSLAKLKQHLTAGVTLTMKNLFGITPNSRYGDEAGSEDATAGRNPLHTPFGFQKLQLAGLKPDVRETDPGRRVPRIVVDLCAARPIHLAIIDGITAMSGGEGPWCGQARKLKVTTPGVLIAGLNPVSTDAVGTAVMGYDDPRAARGTKPFGDCENHLRLAEEAGLGLAELARIDVRGMAIAQTRYPYD